MVATTTGTDRGGDHRNVESLAVAHAAAMDFSRANAITPQGNQLLKGIQAHKATYDLSSQGFPSHDSIFGKGPDLSATTACAVDGSSGKPQTVADNPGAPPTPAGPEITEKKGHYKDPDINGRTGEVRPERLSSVGTDMMTKTKYEEHHPAAPADNTPPAPVVASADTSSTFKPHPDVPAPASPPVAAVESNHVAPEAVRIPGAAPSQANPHIQPHIDTAELRPVRQT